MENLNIWFFTDIHGSEACFKKFLKLIRHEYKPNVLIIGGDITGKKIVPIIKNDKKNYEYEIYGEKKIVSETNINNAIKEISDSGGYPYKCNEHEFNTLAYNKNGNIYNEKINELAKTRLQDWVSRLDKSLKNAECKVFISGGNDDPLFVDDILGSYSPEGKVIELRKGIKLISTGYSTLSPWKCPRDITEEELKKKIETMTTQLEEGDKVIFNFHCPPYNTSIDIVNEIDEKTFIPKGQNKVHAGSKVIKEAIEQWQPIVSLHGHIHEIYAKEKIGNTLCYNPGSDFQHGKLQGVFLTVTPSGEIQFETLTKELQHTIDRKIKKKINNFVLGIIISLIATSIIIIMNLS